ncbi:MAG: sigma-54-dependent transcriptional regulator [Pirellula sp.]
MRTFNNADTVAIRAICELNYTNPFTSRRIELEQLALGAEFDTQEIGFWSHIDPQNPQRRANVIKVAKKAKSLLSRLHAELHSGQKFDTCELQFYVDLACFVLFDELLDVWEYPSMSYTDKLHKTNRRSTPEIWKKYSKQFDHWLLVPGCSFLTHEDKGHLFAIFHQIYRAFFAIFYCVIGRSKPAALLRSRIWESIFTVNMRRYRDSLYKHLAEVTTLVTGPSGSGKELVSRSIGLSRYIPFDRSKEEFRSDFSNCYWAVNIAALSSNLVESELFGHAKGSFTGAVSSRAGWLEICGQDGSILLDEIGELEMTTQVKLLRVLQNREFQRIGESKTREFQGKLIAATNRDLQNEIQNAHFREDLYYRLCADVIETPSLQAQVKDNPDVLPDLVGFIVQRIAPDVQAELTNEIVLWLEGNVPANYSWPGNFRELEQSVRNLMIHGSYQFQKNNESRNSDAGRYNALNDPQIAALAQKISDLDLTADELTSAYCKIAYSKTQSFEKAAQRLQLDRRTVRRKSDASKDSRQARKD